jgi:broad specificity phosphatase PhoE
VTLIYLVQHAQKQAGTGDPELTAVGHDQAARTARWLSRVGLTAVYSSPQRRARQTADAIAAATGLEVRLDDRLRERMNWDGRSPLSDFLAEWDRCTRDRDLVPAGGDSSHQAGARLREFLAERIDEPGPVAVVSHGGVTVDLLRTLLGNTVLPGHLIADGVPPCAITTFDGLAVVAIAGTDHLREDGPATG